MVNAKTPKPLDKGGFDFNVLVPRYSNNSKAHERIPYLKINFYQDEMLSIDKKLKKVSSIFNQNGVTFNEQEFYRIFTLNMDNEELLTIMFKLYKEQSYQMFGGLQNAS